MKVLENKQNNKRVLVKYLNGEMDVYKKLLIIVHPNIPIVYEVAQSENKSIIVEEYIDGITVDEVLEAGRYTSIGVKKIIIELCSAFWSCDKLMSIKFPNKLKEIGDGAFEKCESLETVIIPNNVNTIENNAFAECCNLKSVTLPNNITKINSGLFMNTSLKKYIFRVV